MYLLRPRTHPSPAPEKKYAHFSSWQGKHTLTKVHAYTFKSPSEINTWICCHYIDQRADSEKNLIYNFKLNTFPKVYLCLHSWWLIWALTVPFRLPWISSIIQPNSPFSPLIISQIVEAASSGLLTSSQLPFNPPFRRVCSMELTPYYLPWKHSPIL